MTRTCKDIAIRPYCSLRQTRNTPVFIKSPESQKQILREFAEVEARKSKDIHQLGSLGLARSKSWSQLVIDVGSPKYKVDRQLHFPPDVDCMQETRPPSPHSDDSEDSDDSDSEADSDASLDDQDFAMFDMDSPVSSSSAFLWNAPERTLKDAIRRRVNEQVMLVNLKHLTFKGQMRYGGRDSTGSNLTPDEVALRRQAVGLKAANFTELYSDTLGILEAHMTLTPPSRSRHSITNADLGTYTTLLEQTSIRHVQSEKCAPESCVIGMAHPARRTCPAGFAFEPKNRATPANDIGDNLRAIEEF